MRVGADAVLLTGDERAVDLVEANLLRWPVRTIARRQAGGRHEPGTVLRLRAAALEERCERTAAATAVEVDRLREELGQHDRAVDGSINVIEALAENRVDVLFIDAVEGPRRADVDPIARAAFAHGARLVVGTGFAVRDGIAALLRVPYC